MTIRIDERNIKINPERDSIDPPPATPNFDRVSVIARQLNDDLVAAASFDDPMLNYAGLQARRLELTEQSRADVAREYLDIQSDAASDVTRTAKALANRRPYIDDWSKASAKWSQADSLLQSGWTLRQVIARADLDMLLATEDFGRAWIAANGTPPDPRRLNGTDEPVNHAEESEAAASSVLPINTEAGLQSAVLRRLGQIKPDLQRYILAARDARIDKAKVDAYEAYLTRGTGSSISAAVAAHYAAIAAA